MQSNGVRALVTAAEIKPGGLKRQKFNAQKLQKYRSIEMHRNAMYSIIQQMYKIFIKSSSNPGLQLGFVLFAKLRSS